MDTILFVFMGAVIAQEMAVCYSRSACGPHETALYYLMPKIASNEFCGIFATACRGWCKAKHIYVFVV